TVRPPQRGVLDLGDLLDAPGAGDPGVPLADLGLAKPGVAEVTARLRLLPGCPLAHRGLKRIGEGVLAAVRAADGCLPFARGQPADIAHWLASSSFSRARASSSLASVSSSRICASSRCLVYSSARCSSEATFSCAWTRRLWPTLSSCLRSMPRVSANWAASPM